MGLSLMEQETSISFDRTSNKCIIYTSDSTVMTKLDKLVENSPQWKLKEEHFSREHELVGKTYETHKRLISFRKDFVVMSEENRQAAAERARRVFHKDKSEKEECDFDVETEIEDGFESNE